LMLPSLYRLLLQHCDKQKLRSLRRVIVAGENCPEDLVRLHARSMISTRLFNEYGPTEASVWATACEMHRDDGVSIGRSVPGVEARLLDRHGCEQPIGAVGEIYLGGTRLAKGYRGDPALTDSRFVTRDGQRLYRTGDLARLRADGSLTYLGRIDQQLKVHGQRVEAAEIESALTSIPIIREAAVALSAAPAKELNLERESDLLDALERLDGPLASRLLSEAESIESSTETYELADSDVRVTVQLVNGDFIRTPRERQKKWLLDQVMRETVADLHSLDEVARRMVPGSDSPHLPRDLATEQLSEQEIMEDWQTPLMRSMVQWVTEAGGDVLEIGFGRGVAATAIQQAGVRSHTVIEMNPHSIEDHFRPWRQSYSQRDIRLVEGRWQDALDRLDEYDGVFFHAFPMNEAEFVEYVATSATFAEHFFPHAAALLRSGGVFTYLSTEIDSLSRRHQRSLLKHFGEVQFKVQRLEIPAETKDAWWADSMVVVRAIK
ncbi:MAG: AMP-binding protein, partial [Planctomycetota bacterium]